MSDTTQQQKKESILKSLAILGFIGTIVVIAWLSVQLIQILPSAFSSLASLAESVYNERHTVLQTEEAETLAITSTTTLATAGEPVTITWSAASVPGNFAFSYHCADGVAIDLADTAETRSITCDTLYDIGNVTTLTFLVDSEKRRYADIWYTISFLGTNDTEPRASSTAQLTVVNSTITSSLAEATPEVAKPTKPAQTTPTISETPTTPTIPKTETIPVTPTTQPKPEQEYSYTIPVSNPQGKVDLATRYLDLGKIINNSFVASAVRRDEAGAIQFEVKNHGTKTSGTWTYSITLPDGDVYRSKSQAALKPNERAVLTIGFPAVSVSSHTFIVTVNEASDQVVRNDSFQKKVTFSN
jgi:hypothetical protein